MNESAHPLTPIQRIALGKLEGKWVSSLAQIDAHPAGWREVDVAAVKQWFEAQGFQEARAGFLDPVAPGCFEITLWTTGAESMLAHEAQEEKRPLTPRQIDKEIDEIVSGKWEEEFKKTLKELEEAMEEHPHALSEGLKKTIETIKQDPRPFYQVRLHPDDLARLRTIPGLQAFFSGPQMQQGRGAG